MPAVLLAVDTDPAALADVERQLTDRYARSYRVTSTTSPEQALELLAEFAEVGDDVALVLAAQWLEGITGAELLDRVRPLHPHAKRGLLIPWGEWADQPTAEAISDAMALGRIDSYLLQPAASPDEMFHHAISSLLLDWTRDQRIAPYTVHIVGESWSGRAYELRDVFQRCAIPHAFCLADSDEGRALLTNVEGDPKLPLMVFPNGEVLSDPSNAEIARAAGAPVDFDAESFDVIIVGSGPAGLSAAVYGASEGLQTLVVDEGGIGGQATSSSMIRNYLGFPQGLSGTRLAERAYHQAWVFGTRFVFMHRVTGLARAGDELELSLAEGRRVRARAVILATGASYRRLGVPALEELHGAGVFYGGPVSEGHALTGKEVYIVGGGNSAGQAALHLARFARGVTMVLRAESLGAGMSHYLVREIEATPNVDVLTATAVVDGGGDGRLQHLVLRQRAVGGERTVPADALFVLIGGHPRTDWLPPDFARDSGGFLLTGDDLSEDQWPLERPPLSLETSVPGVLAAGDVRHGSMNRVASAVGEGSIAIQLVHQLLYADELRATGQPAAR